MLSFRWEAATDSRLLRPESIRFPSMLPDRGMQQAEPAPGAVTNGGDDSDSDSEDDKGSVLLDGVSAA